jgi:hypothetical protein
MTSIRSVFAMVVVTGGLLGLTPPELFAQKKQRDRILREEILGSAHRELDLYQVIRSLRPHFLAPPPGVRSLGGSRGLAPISVIIDGKRDIGLEALRTLMAIDVEEVRYLEPARSENEYGPRANGGAVVVKLFKGQKNVPAALDTIKPPPA